MKSPLFILILFSVQLHAYAQQLQHYITIGDCMPGGSNGACGIAKSFASQKYLTISSFYYNNIYCLYLDSALNPTDSMGLTGFLNGTTQISPDSIANFYTNTNDISSAGDENGNYTICLGMDSTLRDSSFNYYFKHDYILNMGLDPTGNIKWQKYFRVNNNSTYRIIYDNNSVTYFLISGNELFAIDTSGTAIWKTELSTTYPLFLKDISIQQNNNLLILGNDSTDLFLAEISASGTVVWQKFFDSGNIDYANAVDIFPNGTIVANAKHVTGYSAGDLIKFDFSGNPLVAKSIPDTTGLFVDFNVYDGNNLIVYNSPYFYQYDSLLSCRKRKVVSSSSWSQTSSSADYVVRFLKILSGFIVLRQSNYGIPQFSLQWNNTKVETTSQLGEYCIANAFEFEYNFNDVNYSEVFKSTSVSLANFPSPYNSSIMYGAGISTYCGPSSCFFDNVPDLEANGIERLLASPNPFTNILTLKGGRENGEAILYDITGKEILSQKTIQGEIRLNTEKIASGFYLLQYSYEKSRVNFKVIKH